MNENTFEKGQEVWVKAQVVEKSIYSDEDVWLLTKSHLTGNPYVYAKTSEIRTTEQILLGHGALAPQPDRSRKFRKGDKVQRRKELYGRPLNKWSDKIPFDTIYEVLEDEDPTNNHNLKINANGEDYWVNFVYFDLVESATEPRYEMRENDFFYNIRDRIKGEFVAGLAKSLYTREEAQAECDRLNRKEKRNGSYVSRI